MHYGGRLEALGPSFILAPLKLPVDQPDYVPLFLFPRFTRPLAVALSLFHRLLTTSSPLCPSPVLTRIIPRIIERALFR